ncbi:hypothetical protein CSX04_02178 [Burkholderia cepacia]|nr:hypothetical protein CSX04_02178 [Burkholderia cepacia]
MIEIDLDRAHLRVRRQRAAREDDHLIDPRIGERDFEDVTPDESGRADEQQFHVRFFRVEPALAERERPGFRLPT